MKTGPYRAFGMLVPEETIDSVLFLVAFGTVGILMIAAVFVGMAVVR